MSTPRAILLDRIYHQGAKIRLRRRIAMAATIAVALTAILTGFVMWPGRLDRAELVAPAPDQVWMATEGNLRITVSAPGDLKAGQLFDLRISISDNDGVLRHHDVDFGDRPKPEYGTDLVCSSPSPPEGPTDRVIEVTHAYRAEGIYNLRAWASTGGCETESEGATVVGKIRVLAGDGGTNGPQRPKALFSHEFYLHGDPSVLVTDAGGEDPDGFVTRVELDWGDFSEPYVRTASLESCEDSPDLWPHGSILEKPGHRYERNGEYTLRLKVTSVGCDGREEQTDTAELRVKYPPTQGS